MAVDLLEVQQEKWAIDAQIEDLRARKRELAAQEDEIVTAESLERKVANMSDAELAKLAQYVEARGIKSGEAFGNVG